MQVLALNWGLIRPLMTNLFSWLTFPTRFRQGETAIIIARAEEISTGCLFEFTNREGQSCCYTSTLGRNLEDQDHLCVAGQEEEEEGEEFNCRDNSSFLVEEVWQSRFSFPSFKNGHWKAYFIFDLIKTWKINGSWRCGRIYLKVWRGGFHIYYIYFEGLAGWEEVRSSALSLSTFGRGKVRKRWFLDNYIIGVLGLWWGTGKWSRF